MYLQYEKLFVTAKTACECLANVFGSVCDLERTLLKKELALPSQTFYTGLKKYVVSTGHQSFEG